MPVMPTESPERPPTYRVDVQQALDTLDHVEMVALADMFERWALTEETITGEHRTMLIEMASDYEAIANFCGQDWRASDPPHDQDIIAFVAASEARARGLYPRR